MGAELQQNINSENISSVNADIEFFSSSQSKEALPPLVIIPNHAIHSELVSSLSDSLSSTFQVHILQSNLPATEKLVEYSKRMESVLQKKGVKWMTMLGIGAGASIVQAAASLTMSRMIRRIILVDATVRPAPSLKTRIIDRLERSLPVGLPLRSLDSAFDARPFLHRIYCPTLVLVSPDAGSFVEEQSKYIAAKIPNAWLNKLKTSYLSESTVSGQIQFSTELNTLLSEFVDIPVKRPQKNN